MTSVEAQNQSLNQSLSSRAQSLETTLDKFLPRMKGGEANLIEAMRYAVLGGGKRLRGYLVTEVASLFNIPMKSALYVGASVEMLHAYSLIHDDLPAMDDDDLRRGKPSTHIKFGEAIAILAGDALQTKAFEILTWEDVSENPDIRIELVKSLAEASGSNGMVGGQVIDMEGENRHLTLPEVINLHAMKTGRLICYSAEAGAILGQANADLRNHIISYGRDLGTAFQIADDILDATASAEELGKTAGKDNASGKSTFVSLLGIEDAKKEANRLIGKAIRHLEPFGSAADNLRALANYVITRRN
ncbi:polyprenyl synthetase family protein [Commensalibacter sp. M0357]|uniref:polyprenyl synthetase family protein n=1 Tax=Commensalibacter TaxID=1079922 RepID=UPI000EFD863B|nr:MULTISPECIES: farnesyl diphosphate synthase [Commensalibacter]MCT6851628.1 polyprenyl synthetase family protein [Commensalibacter sp.]AYN87152.1 polyprenyl synthetase family protein [Commensalibacter melissae]MBI0074458.1 polyprenyl synthetase family protein [Commensalibacter sp. M0357]MBI0084299.1 polyprenyl synthetase family protein [Commensalibacter sp. M0355]MUG78096.1 polyprenyl synthetase family protein [Commensalibacter melissae]